MSLTQLLEVVELLTDQVGTKITLIADQQLIVENLEEKVDDQTAEMQKIKEKQEQQEQVSVELLKTLKEENRTILETLAAIQKMQKEIRDEQKMAREKMENLEKGQEIQKKVEKMCKDVDDLYQRVNQSDESEESDFDASTIVEDIIGLWKHHEPYSTGDRFLHFERRGDQIIERYSDSKATAQGRPGGNYQQYPVYVDYIDIDSSLVGDRLETFGVGREMEGHDVLFVDYDGEEYTIYYRVH